MKRFLSIALLLATSAMIIAQAPVAPTAEQKASEKGQETEALAKAGTAVIAFGEKIKHDSASNSKELQDRILAATSHLGDYLRSYWGQAGALIEPEANDEIILNATVTPPTGDALIVADAINKYEPARDLVIKLLTLAKTHFGRKSGLMGAGSVDFAKTTTFFNKIDDLLEDQFESLGINSNTFEEALLQRLADKYYMVNAASAKTVEQTK